MDVLPGFWTGVNLVHMLQYWGTKTEYLQGPYFGQAAHFLKYHELRLPTAIDRYQKEVSSPILVSLLLDL
jgi:hypothetical protein